MFPNTFFGFAYKEIEKKNTIQKENILTLRNDNFAFYSIKIMKDL